MSMRYTELFSNKDQIAFIPFFMLGDPNLEQSKQLILDAIESGADALELGFPFSDPIADGPVIQESTQRALKNNVTIESCFEVISVIRNKYQHIPIGLLVYANLIITHGVELFYMQANRAGVDSVLIPDVPIEESELFDSSAKQNQIDPVYILPPNASSNLIEQIAIKSKGYTYVVSRNGVTGTDDSIQGPDSELIDQLKNLGGSPPVLGFGISDPHHIKFAKEKGYAGAISGSAVIKRIEHDMMDNSQNFQSVQTFISEMKQAT